MDEIMSTRPIETITAEIQRLKDAITERSVEH